MASSYEVDDILGNSSILQIGKANWGSGEYFKGLIDNMTIRNYALTGEEVAEEASDFVSTLPMVDGAVVGTAPTKDEATGYRGTDDHTAIVTMVDTEKNVLTPYVRKAADVTKLPVTLELNGVSEITVDGKAFTNGSEMNLSKDVEVKVKNTAAEKKPGSSRRQYPPTTRYFRDSMQTRILTTLTVSSGSSRRPTVIPDGAEPCSMHSLPRI